MSVVPERQALLLLLSLLLGASLGFIYSALTPLRRRMGKYGIIVELLYVIAACGLTFVFAMHESLGRLTLWDAAAIGLGFAAYERYLAELTVKICGAGEKLFDESAKKIKNNSKFPNSFFQISKR